MKHQKVTEHDLLRMFKELHAIKRARERYGLHLGVDTLYKIGEYIRNREGRRVERRSNTISVWDVEVQGEIVRVVYSKTWRFPVTFLLREEG